MSTIGAVKAGAAAVWLGWAVRCDLFWGWLEALVELCAYEVV